MSRPSISRLLTLAAMALPLAACQNPMTKDDAPNPQLARAQALRPVASTQRLGPDGYPLLGAYPRSATAQLTDAQVSAQEASLGARARAASAAPGTGSYQAKIDQLRRLRDAQQAEVSAALAAEPAGKRPSAAAAQ